MNLISRSVCSQNRYTATIFTLSSSFECCAVRKPAEMTLTLNYKNCEKCLIEQLKVVDPFTDECVCARRHYLNHASDICEPCSYDCLTCSTNTRCLTCDND